MGYFCGGRNTINFVTFKDKIVIPQLIQKYVVKWYHMYLLHPGIYRKEAMICHHLYCPDIRGDAHMEFMECDIYQRKNVQY